MVTLSQHVSGADSSPSVLKKRLSINVQQSIYLILPRFQVRISAAFIRRNDIGHP